MATLVIKANQQLDLCGDEFLNERDIKIELDFSRSIGYVVMAIPEFGKTDIYIPRDELKSALRLLED